MADNVTVDNSDQAYGDFIVSTDEAASGHLQRMKLAYSADGVDTHIQADASGLLVNLGTNNDVVASGTVTVDGTATVSVDGTASVSIAAGTVTSNATLQTGSALAGYVGISADGTAIADMLSLTNGTAVAVGLYDSDGDQLTFASPQSIGVTPTIDTSAYADGDNLDATILTFANAAATSGGSGYITKMMVLDEDNETTVDYTVYFLNASITPPAENAAFSLSDTDAAKIVGVVSTSADGTWYSYGNGQVCQCPLGPPIPFKLASGTSLFAVVMVGGTPTYAAADDLTFTIDVLRD